MNSEYLYDGRLPEPPFTPDKADYEMEIEQLNRQILGANERIGKLQAQLENLQAMETAMLTEVLTSLGGEFLAGRSISKAISRIVKWDYSLLTRFMEPTDWDICGGGPGEKSGHTPVEFEFEHAWVEFCWDAIDDDVRSDILGWYEEDYAERSKP